MLSQSGGSTQDVAVGLPAGKGELFKYNTE